MSQDEQQIHLPLLANGLDFIQSALNYFSGEPTKRDLKYGVLHLCSGIELVLKERLRREHWSLLFDQPANARKVAYETGAFKSVSFDACLSRLTDIGDVQISEQQRQSLLKFRDKRNSFEHFGVTASVEAIKASASCALSFLVDFISTELQPARLEGDSAERLVDIRVSLAEFSFFVKQRWKDIQSTVQAAQPGLVLCPSCSQESLMLGAPQVRCLFCGYDSPPDEALDDYIASVIPVQDLSAAGDSGVSLAADRCPRCSRSTLVRRYPLGSHLRWNERVCFSCGSLWDEDQLKECCICGGPCEMADDADILPAVCLACSQMRARESNQNG